MATMSGDFEPTMDELRVVARYVAQSAQEILPVFEDVAPNDPRPPRPRHTGSDRPSSPVSTRADR
ncbi:hypothetical protein [Nocardiopsis alkaliphila]|uniref:hypothetical protein n=1 Tax=Nocardiopsis alkaliphila TaxID=225762 RepID=UPI00034DDF2A|nr:hypothetical protein [Nocardiopsis alkaliphila]